MTDFVNIYWVLMILHYLCCRGVTNFVTRCRPSTRRPSTDQLDVNYEIAQIEMTVDTNYQK